MNTVKVFAPAFFAASLAAMAACSDSDVPPGNNSSSILDGRPDNEPPTSVIEQSEVIPEEYRGLGPNSGRIAVATLQPTEGNTASGQIAFIQPSLDEEQVRILIKLVDVPPGQHGFHIHETGNCTARDGSSAGDHFNPTGMSHGDRASETRHVGDLGNVTATAEGTITLDVYDTQIGFNGANSIIDKAVILHAMRDDLTTQPSGNSGDRIACGIIKDQQGV